MAFTAQDLARVAGLRAQQVEVILADFAKQGLVLRAGDDRFEATSTGLELSRGLSLVTPDRRERVGRA